MVNYRFDTFKEFRQFDVVSMIELENIYQELIDYTINAYLTAYQTLEAHFVNLTEVNFI